MGPPSSVLRKGGVYHRLRYPRALLLVPSRFPRALVVLVLVWLAVTPAAAALQPISRVREIARAAPGTHVSLRGIVTGHRAGRSIAVQGQSGSIFAYTEGTPIVVPGDVVEIAGVADVDEAMAPCVQKATYQKVGVADPPQPITVAASELAHGRHEADLVSVKGTL